MIGHIVRWGGPAILLTALAALTGCGVKTLPQAPGSDRPPVAVVETEASGATLLSGSTSTTPTIGSTPVATVSSENAVSPAEVQRNPNAPSGFILDPLLN